MGTHGGRRHRHTARWLRWGGARARLVHLAPRALARLVPRAHTEGVGRACEHAALRFNACNPFGALIPVSTRVETDAGQRILMWAVVIRHPTPLAQPALSSLSQVLSLNSPAAKPATVAWLSLVSAAKRKVRAPSADTSSVYAATLAPCSQKNQRALSVTQRAPSVTQRALSVAQRALSVTQRALSVPQEALSVTQRALKSRSRPAAKKQTNGQLVRCPCSGTSSWGRRRRRYEFALDPCWVEEGDAPGRGAPSTPATRSPPW